MNERIKDLMAHACFETEFDDNQNMPEMMEKFAELIVAEICALLAENREFRAAVIVGTHFMVES